ncbi:hypothetical protein ABZ876_37135 [Streptomyces sp. NPDC046931]|uniref:hypothetical protein n=1 Tax=Streptomyces sp. NPDC046931 TaxID=3154806 RepID=UPI0033D219F1
MPFWQRLCGRGPHGPAGTITARAPTNARWPPGLLTPLGAFRHFSSIRWIIMRVTARPEPRISSSDGIDTRSHPDGDPRSLPSPTGCAIDWGRQ